MVKVSSGNGAKIVVFSKENIKSEQEISTIIRTIGLCRILKENRVEGG